MECYLFRSSLVPTLIAASVAAAPASFAEDEVVRLPGQGELRERQDRDRIKLDRLKPAGGLFVSFDTDKNGTVSPEEIQAGIPIAFGDADANEDGHLTAIEQQSWANGLPTRDDSLANPVRFDPNLDRRVSLEEFTSVISDLGAEYAEDETGDILIENLKARKKREGSEDRERGDRPQIRPDRSAGPAS